MLNTSPPYYFYSYSFNCVQSDERMGNLGFATSFSVSGVPQVFKTSQVRNPSVKMMLVEEPTAKTPGEMPPGYASVHR
jgi:hypothetical protein